jgi:phosphate-selective porin OprO/OprP
MEREQMTKKLVYGVTAALALSAGGVFAQETDASIYDKIWGYGTWYDNDEAAIMQKFALSGRLQGDAFSFNDGDRANEDIVWRRFRFGFKTTLFQDFTVHAELDGDMNNADSGNTWDDFYNRITDAYVKWSPSQKAELKVGKQSAGFTLDGATSSKKLIVPERNIVAENMWFGTEYFTGASLGGKIDDLSYKAGGFSASGEEEFGHFDNGYFGLLSVGHKVGNGTLRLDYVYNDAKESDDGYENGTRDLEHIVALVHKTKLNDKVGIWSDLSYAVGMDGMSDLFGGSVKPFYDISENFQVVLEYAGVTSLDNEADVNMSRYAARNTPTGVRRNRGETVHNLLAGFNWYLYGHKLKWHNAIEYNYAANVNDSGDDYNGYGVTSALRISW